MLGSASSSKPQLRIPVLNAAGLRIAELSSRVTFMGARPFPASRWHELGDFAPNVVIGSGSELQRLMERMDLQTLDLPSVDHAVFVSTEVGDKPLADTMRVALWQRFGVPVYELYLGPNREMLARECEAQEGWHVEPGVHFFLQSGQLALQVAGKLFPTGLTSRLETGACSCGRPGMRVVPASVLPQVNGSRQVASA